MTRPRLPLLVSSVSVVTLALIASAAGPAASEPPPIVPFGSHVSSCATMSTGFSGQHNPSHHRVPGAVHDMPDMHC